MSKRELDSKTGRQQKEDSLALLRHACTPLPKRGLRHITILVTGLQAREDEKYTVIVRDYNRDPDNKAAGRGMTRCDNPKEGSIIADILRSICKIEYKVSTSYIRRVAYTILYAMKLGMNITLIGYSYGGSVIQRALNLLRAAVRSPAASTKTPESSADGDAVPNVVRQNAPLITQYASDDGHGVGLKMRAYSFGSIQLPDKRARVFPVQNFLFPDDWPALSCNHALSEDERSSASQRRRRQNVTWLRQPLEAFRIPDTIARGIFLHKSYPIQRVFPRNDPAFLPKTVSATAAPRFPGNAKAFVPTDGASAVKNATHTRTNEGRRGDAPQSPLLRNMSTLNNLNTATYQRSRRKSG